MIPEAVVLAAGTGQRLAGSHPDVPKGLLEVAGVSLMARSVARLRRNGVERITIVTGHQAQAYDQFAARYGGLVRCVHNARFTEGALLSMLVGMKAVDGPFLLLDSDIIFEDRAVAAIQASGLDSAIVVANLSDSGDEVYTWAHSSLGSGHGRLTGLSKDVTRHPGTPLGEFVGILAISGKLKAAMMAQAEVMLASQPHISYEPCLEALLDRAEVGCVVIDDLVWAEIDDQKMLERVLRDVGPRVDAVDGAI